MTRWVHTIRAVAICGWMLATGVPASAQEYVPVEVTDVKESPQRFWARGIVFRDVLKEHPGASTIRVDDRTITRFALGTLGDVYASDELVARIAALPLDAEYLFSGTVGQRGKKFFFMGTPKYFFLIKDISEVKTESKSIPEQLAAINRGVSTNIYNRVFASLEAVMAEVQKDLFAYAESQNIPFETVFDVNAGHMPKVMSSINAALRRAEDRSRMPVNEFLASVIAAMMANQSGYVEETPEVFVPETAPVEPAVETTNDASVSSWDLSTEPEAPAEPEAAVEPPAEAEGVDAVIESVLENQPEKAPESTTPAPATESKAGVLDDPFWADTEPAVPLETKTAVEMVEDELNNKVVNEPEQMEKPVAGQE